MEESLKSSGLLKKCFRYFRTYNIYYVIQIILYYNPVAHHSFTEITETAFIAI